MAADVPAVAQVISATALAPYLGLKLGLDPVEVGEVVAQLGPEQGPPTTALAVSALGFALLDAVTRLLALLKSPQEALVLTPLVRREIIYRLLVGPEGGLREPVAVQPRVSPPLRGASAPGHRSPSPGAGRPGRAARGATEKARSEADL